MNQNHYHPAAERLEAFVEGILDQGDRVVVESHLLGCSQCQNEVEDLRSLFAALARLERFSPSVGFANRVMLHVKLPDPWYSRAGAYVQTFIPKTSRGWAFASALLALPVVGVGALLLWVLSKPFVTGDGLLAFTTRQVGTRLSAFGEAVLSGVMHSDVMLVLVRAVHSVLEAGFTNAGLACIVLASVSAWSFWVLKQNLFRNGTRRSNYASYSF